MAKTLYKTFEYALNGEHTSEPSGDIDALPTPRYALHAKGTHDTYELLLGAAIFFILFFSLVINSLVVVSFFKDTRLQVVYNVYVFHLAIADILFCIAISASTMIGLFHWIHIDNAEIMCQILTAMMTCLPFQQLSVLHLMAQDRFKAIKRGFTYSTSTSFKRAQTIAPTDYNPAVLKQVSAPQFSWKNIRSSKDAASALSDAKSETLVTASTLHGTSRPDRNSYVEEETLKDVESEGSDGNKQSKNEAFAAAPGRNFSLERMKVAFAWVMTTSLGFFLTDLSSSWYPEETVDCHFPSRLLYIRFTVVAHLIMLSTLVGIFLLMLMHYRKQRRKRTCCNLKGKWDAFIRFCMCKKEEKKNPIRFSTVNIPRLSSLQLVPRGPVEDFNDGGSEFSFNIMAPSGKEKNTIIESSTDSNFIIEKLKTSLTGNTFNLRPPERVSKRSVDLASCTVETVHPETAEGGLLPELPLPGSPLHVTRAYLINNNRHIGETTTNLESDDDPQNFTEYPYIHVNENSSMTLDTSYKNGIRLSSKENILQESGETEHKVKGHLELHVVERENEKVNYDSEIAPLPKIILSDIKFAETNSANFSAAEERLLDKPKQVLTHKKSELRKSARVFRGIHKYTKETLQPESGSDDARGNNEDIYNTNQTIDEESTSSSVTCLHQTGQSLMFSDDDELAEIPVNKFNKLRTDSLYTLRSCLSIPEESSTSLEGKTNGHVLINDEKGQLHSIMSADLKETDVLAPDANGNSGGDIKCDGRCSAEDEPLRLFTIGDNKDAGSSHEKELEKTWHVWNTLFSDETLGHSNGSVGYNHDQTSDGTFSLKPERCVQDDPTESTTGAIGSSVWNGATFNVKTEKWLLHDQNQEYIDAKSNKSNKVATETNTNSNSNSDENETRAQNSNSSEREDESSTQIVGCQIQLSGPNTKKRSAMYKMLFSEWKKHGLRQRQSCDLTLGNSTNSRNLENTEVNLTLQDVCMFYHRHSNPELYEKHKDESLHDSITSLNSNVPYIDTHGYVIEQMYSNQSSNGSQNVTEPLEYQQRLDGHGRGKLKVNYNSYHVLQNQMARIKEIKTDKMCVLQTDDNVDIAVKQLLDFYDVKQRRRANEVFSEPGIVSNAYLSEQAESFKCSNDTTSSNRITCSDLFKAQVSLCHFYDIEVQSATNITPRGRNTWAPGDFQSKTRHYSSDINITARKVTVDKDVSILSDPNLSSRMNDKKQFASGGIHNARDNVVFDRSIEGKRIEKVDNQMPTSNQTFLSNSHGHGEMLHNTDCTSIDFPLLSNPERREAGPKRTISNPDLSTIQNMTSPSLTQIKEMTKPLLEKHQSESCASNNQQENRTNAVIKKRHSDPSLFVEMGDKSNASLDVSNPYSKIQSQNEDNYEGYQTQSENCKSGKDNNICSETKLELRDIKSENKVSLSSTNAVPSARSFLSKLSPQHRAYLHEVGLYSDILEGRMPIQWISPDEEAGNADVHGHANLETGTECVSHDRDCPHCQRRLAERNNSIGRVVAARMEHLFGVNAPVTRDYYVPNTERRVQWLEDLNVSRNSSNWNNNRWPFSRKKTASDVSVNVDPQIDLPTINVHSAEDEVDETDTGLQFRARLPSIRSIRSIKSSRPSKHRPKSSTREIASSGGNWCCFICPGQAGFQSLITNDPTLALVLSFALVFGTQLLCWLPRTVLYLYYDMYGYPIHTATLLEASALLLWYCRMVMAPSVYLYYSKGFRENFSATLKWMFCKK